MERKKGGREERGEGRREERKKMIDQISRAKYGSKISRKLKWDVILNVNMKKSLKHSL